MGEGLPPHKICPSGTFASSRPPPCPWGGSQKALEEAVWVGRARGGVWAPEASHPLGRRAFREPLRTGRNAAIILPQLQKVSQLQKVPQLSWALQALLSRCQYFLTVRRSFSQIRLLWLRRLLYEGLEQPPEL